MFVTSCEICNTGVKMSVLERENPVDCLPFSSWVNTLTCCCVLSWVVGVLIVLYIWSPPFVVINVYIHFFLQLYNSISNEKFLSHHWISLKSKWMSETEERKREKWGLKTKSPAGDDLCWRWCDFPIKAPHDMRYCHMAWLWSVIQARWSIRWIS